MLNLSYENMKYISCMEILPELSSCLRRVFVLRADLNKARALGSRKCHTLHSHCRT